MEDEITGRRIIEHLLLAMEKEYRHPLYYSELVAGLYEIYLRPEDYERLENLFPRIREEARKALDEKLKSLNAPGLFSKFKRKVEYVNLMRDWYIDFQPDVDNEEIPSDEPFGVRFQIALPPEPEYGLGTKTISLKTKGLGRESKPVDKKQGQILARISYTDDTGNQAYLMTKKQIVIGRGGKAHWVDLQLYTVDDVSRNHLRIRYDDEQKGFLVKDISSLGTTVNGARIPSSLETVNGVARETDLEVPIASSAKIGLADKLLLDFRAESTT